MVLENRNPSTNSFAPTTFLSVKLPKGACVMGAREAKDFVLALTGPFGDAVLPTQGSFTSHNAAIGCTTNGDRCAAADHSFPDIDVRIDRPACIASDHRGGSLDDLDCLLVECAVRNRISELWMGEMKARRDWRSVG
jgi:hypothetical protein